MNRCVRAFAAMIAVLCVLAAMSGCGETGAGGPRPTGLPVTTLPVVSSAPDIGGQTASQPPVDTDANPIGIWFYDEDIQLPLALYGEKGLRFSMILCADLDDGKTCNATGQAAWSIEDPAVASVKDGVITALQSGKTTIRVKYGKFSAETSLIVFDSLPDRLIIDAGGGAAKAGGEPLALYVQLGFEGRGEYLANACVQVYSTDPGIVRSANEGGELLLYGVGAGEGEVIVSAFGLSDVVKVTVTEN